MYKPQSRNVPVTFAGGCLHDEVVMVLLMSRERSSDEFDETEVETCGGEDDLSCSGKSNCEVECQPVVTGRSEGR